MTTASNDFRIGVAAVLFASVVWGTTGTAASFAPEVSAAAIGAAAMGIGGLLQAVIAAKSIRKAIPDLALHWRKLLLGGLAVALYPLAFYGSMRLAGVTIGTVVTIGSAPLLSALIENVFDGARLSKRWLIGALMGLLGMMLLCIAESSSADVFTGGHSTMTGIALGLVGGLTYALYSWTARGLMLQGIRSSAAMGATFGIGGILLMPVLVMTGAPFLASWNNAAVGIYMALVPMFLGYVCFGIGLARISASMATTITLIEPVIAAMLAVAIIGERLPFLGWLGVVLIICCLIVITVPMKLSLRRPRALSEHS